MTQPEAGLVLGVDLGGTKTLCAVASRRGEIIGRDLRPTLAVDGPEAGVRALLDAMHGALADAGVAPGEVVGIGLGVPGLIDVDAGVMLTSPNLPGWRDVPLRDIVQREFGVATHLVNDASAAALGEARYGAGRGVSNFVYVTLSTGIGAGIVIDGKLYVGKFGGAGELGHMTIQADGPPCTCGGNGCWETLASGTALTRDAKQQLSAGEASLMLDYADGDIGRVDAPLIHRAALAGDRLANELIVLAGYYVGIGLANIINIFNPELIVLGGGLTNLGTCCWRLPTGWPGNMPTRRPIKRCVSPWRRSGTRSGCAARWLTR